MSILALFDIGRSGIAANQLALRVASNNIANINTPGYSRQDAIMQIANPVKQNGQAVGRGVGDVEIRRHFDNFTFIQIVGQSTNYGRSSSLQSGLSNVEQIFNEAQGFGLSNTMGEYFDAWQKVANNDSSAKSQLLVAAEAFTNTAKQIETDLKNTIKFSNNEIADMVDQVNVLSKNIAEVNGKIMEIEAGGIEHANVFRDQRERLMKDLSEIIDYDFNQNTDGTVTIVAGRKSIVAGVQSFQFTTELTVDGDRDVFSDGKNITSFIKSGKLGGFISVRDDVKNNALTDLRKLTASIRQETNAIHAAGWDKSNPPVTGVNFFDTLQLFTRNDSTSGSAASITVATIPDQDPIAGLTSLNEYDIVFTNPTTYEVRDHATGAALNPAITGVYNPAGTALPSINGISITIAGVGATGDSFFVSPIHYGVQDFNVALTSDTQVATSQDATSPADDNRNALDMVTLHSSTVTNLDNNSFNDHYAEMVSTVGSMSQSAIDSLEFDDNLLFELKNRREALSGVSLDEEAANLIRFQRAFEAGARIIKLTDELLELVINL